MKSCFLLFLATFLFISCEKSVVIIEEHTLYKIDHIDYIKEFALPPQQFLYNQLVQYDIVILGERHESRDNLLFIRDSLERLYSECNLRYFATEFVRSHNYEKINAIVTSDQFKREEVIDIYRDFAWIWGFEEYVDIIEEIWRINSTISNKYQVIEVIAMDFEWKDWFGANVEYDVLERDKYMFNQIKEIYEAGSKMVVHTGFNHSFLDYKQNGFERLGNYLNLEYRSVYQICLHHYFTTVDGMPWGANSVPEYFDYLYRMNGSVAFGIDIIESPLSDLRDETSIFFVDEPDSTLVDITKGYIIFNTESELTHSRWIKDFIDESNFDKAKDFAISRNWIQPDQDITLRRLNKIFKERMTF